jgi:type IV pilus assembly protein PilP
MRLSTFVGLALAALPFVLTACEDKPPPRPPAPAAPPPAVASVAPAATKTGPEYAESDFLENDRNRDPFRSYPEVFSSGDNGSVKAPHDDKHVLLSQFSLEELKLAGIVQAGDYPRAMLIPPSGKGTVIKRGDWVGKAEVVHQGGTNGTDYFVNWRVDRVRDGDVVMVLQDPSHVDLPKQLRVLNLHPDAERAQQEQDERDLLNGAQL